jgi:hypothetical protein
VTRGNAEGAPAIDGFLDIGVFRTVRNANDARDPARQVPVADELLPSDVSMRQKADLMLHATKSDASRLVVGYFPLMDEFNHAWFDRLEIEWPSGRVSELFTGCFAMIDDLLTRLMATADRDTLLAVSSDHGAASHRGMLHVNELFADAGLVRRLGDGYDLRRSSAYYHPSDCGQVVAREPFDRGRLFRSVQGVVARANGAFGARIAVLEGSAGLPYVAFLYPLGDTYFTGKPPGKDRPALNKRKMGGHHLSPLCPTPWIQAMLGLWSPRTGALPGSIPAIPGDNRDLKRFLLEAMGYA